MDRSFQENYPTFTYNNQSVILRPGNQFTKNELRSRLHQMDVDSIGIDSRAQLINLYESTLRDDRNKFKLFDRLRDDTVAYASKMGISLNKTMPMSTNNEIHKQERSKVINLKYAAQNETPYEENNYEEKNNRSQNIISFITYLITIAIGYYSDNIITIDNFNGSTVNNYLSVMLPPLFFLIIARHATLYFEKFVAILLILFSFCLITGYFLVNFTSIFA